MANTFDEVVDTNMAYEALGASLTQGNVYAVQVKGGTCNLSYEADGGILVENSNPFNLTANGSTLYIKTNSPCRVTIM